MALELRAKNNHILLRCIDLHMLSEKYSSPFFLYDLEYIKERIKLVKENLNRNIKVYYAVKANPNFEILKRVLPLVDGVDISSGGEFRQVLKAGFRSEQISFAGPGKTDEELSAAITEGIGSISVESLNELKRIEKIAEGCKKRANVSIRINPTKVCKEFSIKMGGKPSQFGIDEEKYKGFFKCLRSMERCDFIGIHIFSGTQCLDEDALNENIQYILQLSKKIFKSVNIKLKTINFGGGFGVPYFKGQKEINIKYICSKLVEQFDRFKQQTGLHDCAGIIELGRYLIAQAGIYIAKVIDIKDSRGKRFCVLDGGMNHHLAASGKFGQIIRENFKIVNLSNTDNSKKEQINLVGPLCTSLDIIANNVAVVKPKVGDYIAILNSGAYVYTASPLLFLSHDTPVELFVDGETVKVIRPSYKIEEFS